MVQHYENSFTLSGEINGSGLVAYGFSVSSVILPTAIMVDISTVFNNTDSNESPAEIQNPTIYGWAGSVNDPGQGTYNNYDGNETYHYGNVILQTVDGTARNEENPVPGNSKETRRVTGNFRFNKNSGQFGDTYLNPSMTYGLRLSANNFNNVAGFEYDEYNVGSGSADIKIIGRKMT